MDKQERDTFFSQRNIYTHRILERRGDAEEEKNT
jgi:hypothetical protein